ENVELSIERGGVDATARCHDGLRDDPAARRVAEAHDGRRRAAIGAPARVTAIAAIESRAPFGCWLDLERRPRRRVLRPGGLGGRIPYRRRRRRPQRRALGWAFGPLDPLDRQDRAERERPHAHEQERALSHRPELAREPLAVQRAMAAIHAARRSEARQITI